MTNEIRITDLIDKIYKLDGIGLEGVELVIDVDEGNYFSTEDDYFPFKSKENFNFEHDYFYILNEEGGKLTFTKEQFEEILKLI